MALVYRFVARKIITPTNNNDWDVATAAASQIVNLNGTIQGYRLIPIPT